MIFKPIEAQIARWRASGAQPSNLRLIYDMPDTAAPARKFKTGDMVRAKDDTEDYGGLVGIVTEDDGAGEEAGPYSVHFIGKSCTDCMNASELDAWAPPANT